MSDKSQKDNFVMVDNFEIWWKTSGWEGHISKPIAKEAWLNAESLTLASYAEDAERYRWLKSRMVGVSFDWDDEGMTALAFEMPDNLSFCADCDKNIDAAMLSDLVKPLDSSLLNRMAEIRKRIEDAKKRNMLTKE